ncbi:MAG: aminotransferase class V-fold PLP-dependent enzyme [Nitrosopumilus sp. H13]|nr:MAG: aminotransferase class V-fold PLP-dependent enzyme [Nitrosopumilus sp. H13]
MERDISADFAGSDKIYVNNASVSLMPVCSIDAMREFLVSYCSLGPDSAESDEFVREKLQNARRVIAEIISCQPDEVVLTQSTTDGVNMVANGLRFGTDSNMVIRGMSHEHHSNLYPWLRLGTSVKSMQVDEDGFFKTDDLRSRIDKNTKLVALSHALYNTGAILPVGEAGKICGEVPFFVDCAQSVGCMEVDASRIGCDFMSFNGSKWLCGPMGTGLFYCSRKSSELLEPSAVGGESAILHDARLVFKEMPARFQTGFRNYVGMVGMESSARYLLKFGIANIREKNRRLAGVLRDEISRIPGSVLYGPDDPDRRTSIVSFNIAGMDPQKLVDRLQGQGIVLAAREIVDTKIVRASPHLFNTEAEMVRITDAIKRL